MKNLTKLINKRGLSAIVFLSFIALIARAQDSTTTTTRSSRSVTTETTTVEPWMWIVGATVLIIIILALVRGNRSSGTRTR